MMDISHAMRGPIVGGEGLAHETTGDESLEEDRGNGRTFRNLKRKLDDDFICLKKRRKQLKPIRIATNLDDTMVKVPKQIVSLNNDLDNINDMSHAVPKETSSKGEISPNISLDDVHFRCNDDRFALETTSNSNGSPEKCAREIEKPVIPDINVPNLEMGPNFITNPNFIFPFTFQPMKNPHFWSDASMKIFNQEAYCELCKKEFCNKYFLKTHKANKHGIYVDFPSGSSGKRDKGEAQQQQQQQQTTTAASAGKPPENGKNPAGDGDCERAFCELCNKKFCNKYFVRRHKSKSHGLPDEESPYHEADSNSVQNSAINSTKKTVSIVTTCDSLGLMAKENDFDNQKSAEVQESPLNLIVKDGSDEEEPGEEEKTNDGDDCSSENIEKLQTMLLRLNPSEAEGKTCKLCNEAVDGTGEHRCPGQRESKCEYLSDSSNESKNEFQVPKTDGHDFLYVTRLDHLKQMKPTSSYCEICNKELCNKYFMRTHMQRMHGIEIEHGTQIGGVVCNICNKELCSKYFLRVHKQNTHGIVSPNSLVGPSTSGNPGTRTEAKGSRSDPRFSGNFSQVCHMCNKRFRSPKWLQAHFLSDHRDEPRPAPNEETNTEEEEEKEDDSLLKIPKKSHPPEQQSQSQQEPPEALDVISKLFWEKNSSSKSYNCSQCPFTTSVLAFLFVHERSHFVLTQDPSSDAAKPPISLQSLLHDQSFWQRKITQQISECLDLSSGKSKYVSFEQNGS